MAYQVIPRNSGIFKPEACDQINQIVENIDKKIDNLEVPPLEYYFNRLPLINGSDGILYNQSFIIGNMYSLNFSTMNGGKFNISLPYNIILKGSTKTQRQFIIIIDTEGNVKVNPENINNEIIYCNVNVIK